jgi:hypothetical protein
MYVQCAKLDTRCVPLCVACVFHLYTFTTAAVTAVPLDSRAAGAAAYAKYNGQCTAYTYYHQY